MNLSARAPHQPTHIQFPKNEKKHKRERETYEIVLPITKSTKIRNIYKLSRVTTPDLHWQFHHIHNKWRETGSNTLAALPVLAFQYRQDDKHLSSSLVLPSSAGNYPLRDASFSLHFPHCVCRRYCLRRIADHLPCASLPFKEREGNKSRVTLSRLFGASSFASSSCM